MQGVHRGYVGTMEKNMEAAIDHTRLNNAFRFDLLEGPHVLKQSRCQEVG